MGEGYDCKQCGYYWEQKHCAWMSPEDFPICPKCGKKMTRFEECYFLENKCK